MDLKNILFLTPWYPNINSKMSGLFIQRHAYSVSLYKKVAVLFVSSDPTLKRLLRIDVCNSQFPEIKIHYKKFEGILKILMFFLFIIAHVKGLRILRKEYQFKPDLLHVNILTREGVVALFYKWIFSVKYVITEHWTRYHSGNFHGLLRRLLTKLVVKQASAILPVSEHLAESMRNQGLKNNNYVVVPNVVDTDLFKPKEDKISNKKINIIHISCTNDEQKNISGILKAIHEVSKLRNDFVLRIVGEAVDFPKLKNLTNELQLNEVVEFTGLLEGAELAELIANSDFHLMFSNYENLPVVNLECFASGIPVLSSNVGGIKEHLNDKLGLLVIKGDQNDLVKNINIMLNSFTNYRSDYIRKYAVENFSQKSIGEKIASIYDAL